jgi:hypothetical protein
MELIHNHRDISHRVPLAHDEICEIATVLTSAVLKSTMALRHIAIGCDTRLGLELGTCFFGDLSAGNPLLLRHFQ